MYTALFATSQTIVDYLQNRLQTDPNLRLFFDPMSGGTMKVSLRNPEEMSTAHEQGLSVWLYRITRDEDLLNDPPERLMPELLRQPPLPLRLHYLMTPVVDASTPNNSEIEQRVLGKVLQALYGHALFRGTDLSSDFAGTSLELRIRLEPMTLEEITRVWNALEEPYQLSVSYEVAVTLIVSEEFDSASPVTEAIPEYGVIIGNGS